MICKYCQAPLDEDSTFCPACGKCNTETGEAEEIVALEEQPEAEEAVEPEEPAEAEEAEPISADEPEPIDDAGEADDACETDDACEADDACEVDDIDDADDADDPDAAYDGSCNEDEFPDESDEALPETDETSDESDEVPSEPAKPRKKRFVWLFIVLGVVAALLLTILCYFTVYVIQNKESLKTPVSEGSEETHLTVAGVWKGVREATQIVTHNIEIRLNPYATIVTDKDVYAVADAAPGDKNMSKVVAVCGNSKLTSEQFQIHYLTQYSDFMSSYGAYIAYLGMDTSLPLSGQASMAEGLTWEQYFVDAAVTKYKEYAAACEKASAENYELEADFITFLDNLPGSLESEATNNGYDSAEAYIQASFGSGVSLADYIEFVRVYYTAALYENSLYDGIEYTDADISDYFDANAQSFEQNGVEKLDVNNVNIRQILIVPDDADGDGTPTDEEWLKAETKAKDIYQQYQSDSTEDNFAALAGENSSDESSSANGGLVEDFYPNQIAGALSDWCFDTARKGADTDLLKDDTGYRIVYYVGQSDTVHWFEAALSEFKNEKMAEIIKQMLVDYPTKVNYQAITLVEMAKG